MTSLALEIVQLFLDIAEEQGEKAAEYEIEHTCIEKRPDNAFGFHKLFALKGKLINCNYTGKGGILYKGDDLVGHGRHNALNYLQKNNLKEDLSFCHTQNLTCLVLATGNALNTSAIDLGELAGVVYGKGNYRCGKRRHCVKLVADGVYKIIDTGS